VRARLDEFERESFRDDQREGEAITRRLLRWPEKFAGRLVDDPEWERLRLETDVR
jgi:hypothetical protein